MSTGICVVAPILLAATSLAIAESPPEQPNAPESGRWSGSLSLDYSQNRYSAGTRFADRTYSASTVINYSVTDDSRLGISTSGYYAKDGDSYDSQGYFWNDSSIYVSTGNVWNPKDFISMATEARITLPSSKGSRRQKLQTAVQGAIKFRFDLNDFINGVYVGNDIRFRKNFHENKTAGNTVLVEYQLSNRFSLDYLFNDQLAAGIFFIARKNWSYNGTAYHPDLIHGEELSYQVSDDISVAIGASNSITYYDPEQGTNPIHDLIDLDKMNYYVSATYKF